MCLRPLPRVAAVTETVKNCSHRSAGKQHYDHDDAGLNLEQLGLHSQDEPDCDLWVSTEEQLTFNRAVFFNN